VTDSENDERRSGAERRAVGRGGRRAADAPARPADRVDGLPSWDPAAAPLLLVVDDFDDGREMVAEYFAFLGFQVAEARNGAEAVEKAGTLLPDVVLLDIVLPDFDGLEVIERIRQSERTRNLKIAVCTAAVMGDVRLRAARAQADMFVPKPFDLPVLALQIVNLIAHSPAITRTLRTG
jgi:CheY-like chemotaxis protein